MVRQVSLQNFSKFPWCLFEGAWAETQPSLLRKAWQWVLGHESAVPLLVLGPGSSRAPWEHKTGVFCVEKGAYSPLERVVSCRVFFLLKAHVCAMGAACGFQPFFLLQAAEEIFNHLWLSLINCCGSWLSLQLWAIAGCSGAVFPLLTYLPVQIHGYLWANLDIQSVC